jgi:hypothetical protein
MAGAILQLLDVDLPDLRGELQRDTGP